MARRTSFVPYSPKSILNKSRRADHLFWTRYSAYPYIGCQHGCAFCYCRERKYAPYDDPEDFAHVIKVKQNAPVLLRRALSRLPADLVFTGDYQPAERKFMVSRQMLEVCRDLGFPVFVLERSPLVLRDLDLLHEINQGAPSIVAFSILTTPDSPSYRSIREIERLAPASEKRFAAMAEFAKAGILTGTCLMPVLPGISDDDATLESVVRWTAEHGGRFVLTGTLTLADQQKAYFMNVLDRRCPHLIGTYRTLYPDASYAPAGEVTRGLARRVRELCTRYGLADRIPRPIIPGDRRAANRRVVEWLANHSYGLELEGASSQRVWAYRKAAWAVEDLQQDLRRVRAELGTKGLQSIAGVGPAIGSELARLLSALESHGSPGSAASPGPEYPDDPLPDSASGAG
jgi:DNA repair photolyase